MHVSNPMINLAVYGHQIKLRPADKKSLSMWLRLKLNQRARAPIENPHLSYVNPAYLLL